MTEENRDTRPTIETVLERINAVGEMFSGEIKKLDAKIDALRAEVQALRDESDKKLRVIIDRLDVIAIEMQEMRAADRDFNRRLRDLESKVP